MSDEQSSRSYPLMAFRLPQDMKDELAGFAEAHGVSASEVVRRAVDEMVSHGPSFFPDETAALLGYRRELKALGINVNQAARKVNSGEVLQDPLDRDLMEQILSNIGEVSDYLLAMATRRKNRRTILRRRMRPKP